VHLKKIFTVSRLAMSAYIYFEIGSTILLKTRHAKDRTAKAKKIIK
jgi:hypothetical protein